MHHPTVRHPQPPGLDTLRRTPQRGLAAVPDPSHRAMIASVLDSGLTEREIARTDAFVFDPPTDLAQAAADAKTLTAELAAFGIDLPAATVRQITVFRRTFDSGLTAHRRILALAAEAQRPHLDRYLTGFAYWHLHSPRYRWQDVYPSLAPIGS